MTKIVILGAKGFIGSHISYYLKKKGYQIKDVFGVDLRDFNQVTKVIDKGDIVFHFAADMGGVGYFSKQNYYPFINNMLIDLNVLKACEKKGAKRLFYPSSACAYPPSTLPLTETMLDNPANPDKIYGWEKLTMIKLCRNSPIDVRVGILHTIFGEDQEWKGEKAKFPPSIVYKALLARKTGKIEIWGNGLQTRTFLYIDDAVEKMFEVTMSNKYYGEVNISSDEIVTVKQSVDWVCDYLGIKPKYIYNKKKPTGIQHRGVDNTKFDSHYKFRSRYSTKQGFYKLVDWMKPYV